MAQLAAEQAAQEGLLRLGARGEHRTEQLRTPALGTLARHRPDLGERSVHLRHRPRCLGGRGGQLPQGRPAHADLPLWEFSREPGDYDGDELAVGLGGGRGQ